MIRGGAGTGTETDCRVPVDGWAILGAMNSASRARRLSSPRARQRLVFLVLTLGLAAWTAPAGAAPLHYRLQPEACEVTFKATSRLMNADGRFARLSGNIVVDPTDLTTAKVTLAIEAASIDTGIGMRDNHLRSEDFLDVKRFPTITFESARVQGTGPRAIVSGKLTIHGVTHDIQVPVDITLTDLALVASGELVVNRGDYGVNYQSMLNPIGNIVRVSFTFRAHAP